MEKEVRQMLMVNNVGLNKRAPFFIVLLKAFDSEDFCTKEQVYMLRWNMLI